MILIIGAIEDAHVAALSQILENQNHDFAVLDVYSAGHILELSFKSGKCPGVQLTFSDRGSFLPSDVSAIWWRLKPRWSPQTATPECRSIWDFRLLEWRSCLRSLYALTPGAFWINDPTSQTRINDKPLQLALASKVGFRVPDTIIGNSPKGAVSLFERHSRVIYKPLNLHIFPEDKVVFTNEVRIDDLIDRHEEIMQCPCIFQEFIEKEFELRATVIGDIVYCARVNTPVSGPGQIDWRHNQFDDIFVRHILDDTIRERLLRFHHEADLAVACYDLIVSRTGEIVFLECNPAGQWLWLEDKLGLPITQALGELLRQKSD